MKKRTSVFLLILLISLTNYARQNSGKQAYVIESIKAYLYFETKGEFSKEITENFSLFNTIIGEGDAGGAPSNSTMVVVRIKRKYLEGMEFRKIRLTATEDGKPKLKQIIDFSLYDENYTYYAAFWLYNTGCGNIKLTAEILNEKTAQGKKTQIVESRMYKNIDFECGE